MWSIGDRRDARQPPAGRPRWWLSQPPAQPDLEQGDIGRGAREGQEGGGGRDLEEGDRLAADCLLAFLQERREIVVVDQPAGRRGCAR